ncbi:MAG: methyltransferase domain-containing protein [Synechococcus sp.]|nr:methyltransferase domain-containing protein [Synechococcus sp.]
MTASGPAPVPVLSEAERDKLDRSDDALFYAQPRFVHHLDAGFRERLTRLYRQRIPACAVVLDLMSSWVSHLPEEVRYEEVIGHGLNAQELAANPRLDRHWLQNLNTNLALPLPDNSVDAALIVAGWQYLQHPEAIATELLRVVRPRGELIVAFSNRMFFQKAPQVWADGTDRDHLAYVERVLTAQGWAQPLVIAEQTRAPGAMGWIGGKGDPFFALVASKA